MGDFLKEAPHAPKNFMEREKKARPSDFSDPCKGTDYAVQKNSCRELREP